MIIGLSDHSKDRLMHRDIDLDKVKKVIRKHEETNPLIHGKIKTKGITENGKKLVVIYAKESKNRFTLITAYYED